MAFSSRRRLVVAAVVAALVAGSCGGGGSDDDVADTAATDRSSPEVSTTTVPVFGGAVVETVELPSFTESWTVTEDAIWVTIGPSADSAYTGPPAEVLQLDRETGATTATVDIQGPLQDQVEDEIGPGLEVVVGVGGPLTVTDDDIWLSGGTRTGASLTRVERPTDDVSSTSDVCDAIGFVPIDQAVWVVQGCGAKAFSRIDRALTVENPTEVDGSPTDFSVGGGAVWIVSDRGVTGDRPPPVLTRIDLTTGDVTGTVESGWGTDDFFDADYRVLATDDAVWMTIDRDDALIRIDPQTLEVTDRFELGGGRVFPARIIVSATADGLWLSDDEGLIRVDPTDGSILDTVELGFNPKRTEVVNDEIWILAPDARDGYRCDDCDATHPTLLRLDPALVG